jgi:hypothetical protein
MSGFTALPSGPDAVRRLKLHRLRGAIRKRQLYYTATRVARERLREQLANDHRKQVDVPDSDCRLGDWILRGLPREPRAPSVRRVRLHTHQKKMPSSDCV